MVIIIQNSIPTLYDPRVKVIPCSADRVPYLPVEIIYLIGQALPRPKSVFNLALINKNSWHYLQPVLFECEVTYEARLVATFGDGRGNVADQSKADLTYQGLHGKPPPREDESIDNQEKCRHGLWTAVCEGCGERIAIRNRRFKGTIYSRPLGSRGMTALHWACRKGDDGLPAALKAIRSANVHQPSYIDGVGLALRHSNAWEQILVGELTTPLFMAVAAGNIKLCKALIMSGCNVNLLQPEQSCEQTSFNVIVQNKIHRGCAHRSTGTARVCYWSGDFRDTCQTAGHVAVECKRPYILKLLLNAGLDPLLGKEPLIHTAVKEGSLSVMKVLLDRYPELSQHRWKSRTPLHSISRLRSNPTKRPLEKLKAIISLLVEKGANLEASEALVRHANSITGSVYCTPLQLVLWQPFNYRSQLELHLPEALIEMGAIWNQYFLSGPSTILDTCIFRAVLWCGDRLDPHVTQSAETRRGYARLVKVMVRKTIAAAPEQGTLQNIQIIPRMEVVLAGFNIIATESIGTPRRYDPLATEVVGKLLLSAGITPAQNLHEEWVESMRVSKNEMIASDGMRSLWEGLI